AAWPLYLAAMLAIAVGMQVLAIWRSTSPERDETDRGATLLALFVLLSLWHVPAPVDVPLLFVSILVFGFLVVLAQTRLGLGDGYLPAMLATATLHSWWTLLGSVIDESNISASLGIQAAAVVLFTLWPFAAEGRFRRVLPAWYGAALAGPAWLLS